MTPRPTDWVKQYHQEVHVIHCQECEHWDHPTDIETNVYAGVSLAVRTCHLGKTATPTCMGLPEQINPNKPLEQEFPGMTRGLSWCEDGTSHKPSIPKEEDLSSWYIMFLRDQKKTIEEVWGSEKPSGYHEWMENQWNIFGGKFIKCVRGYTFQELRGFYITEFTEWMDDQHDQTR